MFIYVTTSAYGITSLLCITVLLYIVVWLVSLPHGCQRCFLKWNNFWNYLHVAAIWHFSETIYMSQPYGFVHPQHPNQVCKLRKSLYGLKQAPQAWFQALQKFLLGYNFQNAKSDTSLFIYVKANTFAYFLVYVDDIPLTWNDHIFLSLFQHSLFNKFSLKSLGTPSLFFWV